MNILDAGIIFFLFVLMFQSYRVGFLDQLLSLVIFLVSGYLAYILSPYLINYIDFFSSNYLVLKIIAIFILFIVFYLIGKLFKVFILDMIDEYELNGFDRFLGMILGLIKGVIVIAIIVFVLSYFEFKPVESVIKKSMISSKILYAISEYKGILIRRG